MKKHPTDALAEKILRMKPRYSVAGMAKLTRKSESWIRQVACWHGISLAEKRMHWTREMDKELIECRATGMRLALIAERIGCNERAVKSRIGVLRRNGRID